MDDICQFNKYGFCKHREKCSKVHETACCEDDNCGVINCVLRHPKVCKYHKENGECRFNDRCKYKHLPLNDRRGETDMSKLIDDMKEKEAKISALERDVSEYKKMLSDAVKSVEKLENQQKEMSMKIEGLERYIKENVKVIEKVNQLETKLTEMVSEVK